MNIPFKKFIEEINFKPTDSFKNCQIIKAKREEENVFHIQIKNEKIVPFLEMFTFLNAINNNFPYKTKLVFLVKVPLYSEKEIRNYLSWIVCDFLGKNHLRTIIKEAKFDFKAEKNLNIFVGSSYVLQEFEQIKAKINKIIGKFGFKDLNISFFLEEKAHQQIQKEEIKHLEQAQKDFIKLKTQMVLQSASSNGSSYKKMKIIELEKAQAKNVSVEGEIFKCNIIKTKTKSFIVEIYITDYEDAIVLKKFVRDQFELEQIQKFKIGFYVNAKGQFEYDTYKKSHIINLKVIEKIENFSINRVEKKPNKTRVELNAHSKMSPMDGIVSPKEWIKRAQQWNHKAIALVDNDSLQAFPEFYNSSINSDVKPIFGLSLSTLEKNAKIIFNPKKNQDLANDKYVVFDLETTQLSPINGEIIEFGAVKIENGQVVDKEQFFIKSTKPLSTFTKQFTGIEDEDLKEAIKEKEALEKIINYFKDYTLVAHNANFDIGFINEKLVKNGFDVLKNPVIDTLIVARFIHFWKKSFRLEAVAKRINVHYDEKVAHRADYDAEVLSNVWSKFIKMLEDKKLKTHQDLFTLDSLDVRKKAFKNKVTLLAKNQKGLKELFTICSKSHVENYANGPSYYFEDLSKRENILLGSGSLQSRLVNKMFFGTKKEIIEEIAHYDYIEVQPLQNFKHFINEDVSWHFVKEILTFVINEALKQNKLIVATGDSRYLDLKDKIKHEIYISTKGLGGKRHYLYNFREENAIYPDQHFLTTNEMIKQFSFLKNDKLVEDIVINNSNQIASLIEEVEVIKKELYTPIFKNANENLKNLVYENAQKMYGKNLPEIIAKRLEKELNPIIEHGYAVIYWISHLLVKKSLEDGYLVGSRGSVGSSLVATMANISEVNPMCPHYYCLKCQFSEFFEKSELNSGYDLEDKKCPQCNEDLQKEGQKIPFETFLGFNANKVPDIDLNFSGVYQGIIHNEVKRLFGEKHTFRAGTISTVAEKTAFGYVKGWMEEKNKTFSKFFIEYLASGLVGTKRTTGQHPGGIIVIPKQFDVEDFTPVNFPANDTSSTWKTTHFDFHAIHDNVLKLDLLGHDDPTAIRMLEKLTNVNARSIPFSDPKVVSLFSSTKALNITPEDINGEQTGVMGVPEFGTQFVRNMLKSSKVTSFGDLISVSGLSHGTDVWATNAEVLIKKQNKTLNEVISCRDDIMSDLIAKDIEPLVAFEIMEKVRKGKGLNLEDEKILIQNNVESWYIDSLKKIKYMFPKAHATAYVMMAWRVAWFKVYYPLEYYATYFTTRADVSNIKVICSSKENVKNTLENFLSRRYLKGENALSNKEQLLIPILEIVNEALARNVKIENISLEKSKAHEWILDKEKNSLIPPFSTVDGLGESAALSIIKARKEKRFISKEDFEKRTSVNKTIMKILENLGLFNNLEDTNQIGFKLF